MSIQAVREALDKCEEDLNQLVDDAYVRGFEEGLARTTKVPSKAQFRKDHKTPVAYGEDYAYVVAGGTKKQAAKLLETDEEFVEEVGIGWKAYMLDGEMQVGYYMGHDITPLWYAWGVML